MTKCSEDFTDPTREAVNDARYLASQLIDTLDRLDDYVRQQQNAGDLNGRQRDA